MTILSLAIDATQARRGAQEAAQAIDQVGKAAENTGRAVDNAAKQVGTSLDAQANKTRQFAKTVEAVGEVTQVSQRVRLLGEEVRNLGSGMSSAASIGQTLSGALIDIAQISGKVEGGFAGFIGLLRANPLLVAATVIGGIATAMSLFGGETKDANEELQRQVQLQDELRRTGRDLELQLQRNADLQRAGFPVNQREQQELRARRLAEAAASMSGGGMRTAAEIQQLTGETFEQTQARLRQVAGPTAGRAPREDVVGGFGYIQAVSEDIARELVLGLARNLRKEAQQLEFGPGFTGILDARQIAELRSRTFVGPPIPEGGVRPPTQAPSNLFPTVQEMQPGYAAPIGPGVGPGYMSPEQLASYQQQFAAPGIEMVREDAKAAQEELRKLEERLQSLRSLGQDVGTAIGSAFFSIVNGAANARQALAALLQQFIAIAQQRAIQGIANSIGNAFAASAPQAAANTPGAGTSAGISLRANP